MSLRLGCLLPLDRRFSCHRQLLNFTIPTDLPSPPEKRNQTTRLNFLILYDGAALHTNTVRDHLQSFGLFSRHQVYYAHAVNEAPLDFSLDQFDVVIVHYSVRLCQRWHISPPIARR